MSNYSLRHLGDGALVCATRDLAARERLTTAELLAHLAEIDDRRLYLPAGYDSMYTWCLGELGFSEDEACKRIRVARAGRVHPVLFPMLSDGRLTVTTALALAPCLTTANASGLLAAAAGRTKAEVERLIAERFPRPDVPDLVMALGVAAPSGEPALERMDARGAVSALERMDAPGGVSALERMDAPGGVSAPERMNELGVPSAPGRVHPRVAPLSAGRYALQCTVDQETHDLLRRAQALLGHSVAPGDLGPVLNRALTLLVTQLEQRRFGATERPRACRRRGDADPRSIPAAVRRQVWERDGGRCTFVGDGGHRCESRTALEFDHIEPLARGGASTPSNLRLRCRAHNQHDAERAYGREFMRHQREHARRERDAARARIDELVPALRNLGLSLADARLAAARAADLPPDSPLEQRLRFVLKTLMPRDTVRSGHVTAAAPSTA